MTRGTTLDPFMVEIIRHRFYAIIDEAVIALKQVSGSPHTNEGHDLIVALYNAEGQLMAGSMGFLHHLTAAAQAARHVITTFAEDPGLFPDDVYLFNDPYSGALHAPDVYLISPIFSQGRLTALVANFVHVTDIGAIDPGGFSPNATESFQEGFQSPGIKLVERGRIRHDVLETLLNMVRDPGLVALDIKSQLAANFVAKERMGALYDEFGVESVLSVADWLMERAEQAIRSRLLELPDGSFRARHYLDLPDAIHRIELKVVKQADSVVYDFTGTSPQSGLGINCTYWGTLGALLAPVFPMLAFDLDWNEGIVKPFTLIAPSGTLVNCVKPAPVSIATLASIHNINHLSISILSRMLAATDKFHHRATATWRGAIAHMAVHGKRSSGEFFVSQLTDAFAGAGGARAGRDGVEVGGEICNVVSRIANVETEELHNPVLYLFRHASTDSGGPGRYRGGLCHEYAVMPHGTDGPLHTVLFGKGVISPMALGVFGGYPGCQAEYRLIRGVGSADLPSGLEELTGDDDELVQWGTYELAQRDAMYVRSTGGGGYGDPLERVPEDVLADVTAGYVSSAVAESVYGVVLDRSNVRVDLARTRNLRLALRRDRVGHEVPDEFLERQDIPRSAARISEYLQFVPSGAGYDVQCTWCGHTLSPAQGWKDQSSVRVSPVSAGGPLRRDSPEFALSQYFCTQCATLLETEVLLAGDAPLTDEIQPPKSMELGVPANG